MRPPHLPDYSTDTTTDTVTDVNVTDFINLRNYLLQMQDYFLRVPAGLVTGQSSVNKFGRSTNVDASADTDIWDRADATYDQKIWGAPTQARLHNLNSTSADDDGDPAGNGAHTVRVFGLTDWDSDEVYEDVTLNGFANASTTNSYVIIHRMRCLTWGSAGPNAGVITATAQTDSTVTAQINAGEGQTQMAIYGIPSTKTAYMVHYYLSAIKASTSLSVAGKLLVNPIPDQQLTAFLTKHTNGSTTEGTNYIAHPFKPYFKIAGPAIVKLQGNASANNTDVSGGFDMILVDN